ncbi:hypothetical protein ABPG74_016276 [Tetrahymena malaccensis]
MMVVKIRYLLFVFLIVLKYALAQTDFNIACSSAKSQIHFFENTSQCLLASIYTYYDKTNLDSLIPGNSFQIANNQCGYNRIFCNSCTLPLIIYSDNRVIGQVLVFFQYYIETIEAGQNISSHYSSVQVNSFNWVDSSQLYGCCSGYCSDFQQVYNLNSKYLSVNIDLRLEKTFPIYFRQFYIIINYCPSFCQSCDAKNVCLQCTNGYYFSEQNVCITCSLNQGYYIDQLYCRKCGNLCQTCQNSVSCSSCIANYYLNGNICSPCYPSCLSCSGPSANNCTVCANSANYISINNSCVSNCDQNQYIDSTNGPQKYCKQCKLFCKTCSNSTTCDSCIDGYVLDSNKQCQPCHKSCQTCDGLLNINCITCANAYFIQTNKICVPNCDQNQYADTINNSSQKYCKQCQILCKSCSNGTTCDSCIDGYSLDSNKQCLPCDKTCQTCNGFLNINCIISTGQCLIAYTYFYIDSTHLINLFSNNNFQSLYKCGENLQTCSDCSASKPLSMRYSDSQVIGNVLIYFQFYIYSSQDIQDTRSSVQVNAFDKQISKIERYCDMYYSQYESTFNINSQQLSVIIDPLPGISAITYIKDFIIAINYAYSEAVQSAGFVADNRKH